MAKRSARARLTWSIGRMTFILALALAGTLTLYMESRVQAAREEALRGRLRALASGAACLFDPEQHVALAARRDGLSQHDAMNSRLKLFASQNGLVSAYTVVPDPDSPAGFRTVVGDGEFGEGRWAGPESEKALRAAYSSGVTVVDRIRRDGSEVYLSAYSPIRSSTGSVAVLVVNYQAGWTSLLDLTHLLLLAGVLLLAVVVGWLISRALGNALVAPVEDLAAQAKRVAGGDLRQAPMAEGGHSEFEALKGSFATMVSSLRRLVGQLGESSLQLEKWSGSLKEMAHATSQGAGDMARMMQELAGGADHTADSTAAIADGLAKMDEAAMRIAENLAGTAELARQTRGEADRGSSLLQDATEQAGEASRALATTSERVADFDAWSGEIGRTAGFITNIAEQINMLATNARIEAARAGESGRGFSIVAEKVGDLAEETSSFAEHIAGINEQVGPQMLALSEAMTNTGQLVASMLQAMTETRAAFEGIVRLIYGMTDRLVEVDGSVQGLRSQTAAIRTVTEEVAGVTEQSAAAIEEVGASMQEQAAMAEELNSAVEKLHELAERLGKEVGAFSL